MIECRSMHTGPPTYEPTFLDYMQFFREILQKSYVSRGGSRIPRRRGRQPSRRGAPAYKFARFSEKLHEIKKILVRGGRTPGAPPLLDLPLVSAPLDGRRPPLYRIPDLPLEYLFYTRF